MMHSDNTINRKDENSNHIAELFLRHASEPGGIDLWEFRQMYEKELGLLPIYGAFDYLCSERLIKSIGWTGRYYPASMEIDETMMWYNYDDHEHEKKQKGHDDKQEKPALKEKIMGYLTPETEISLSEISEMTGIGEHRILYTINELRKGGKLIRIKKGLYAKPDGVYGTKIDGHEIEFVRKVIHESRRDEGVDIKDYNDFKDRFAGYKPDDVIDVVKKLHKMRILVNVHTTYYFKTMEMIEKGSAEDFP